MLKIKILLTILFLAIAIVTTGIWTETGQASPPESGCTLGAAQSALEATPVGLYNVGNSKAGLGDGVTNCSAWLFLDGQTFSFNSSDFLLLGYTNFIPYEYLGLSRAEGIAMLVSAQESVYFGEAGSSLTEVEIINTAVKTAIHPDFGKIVYQGVGFVTQLEAGDYEVLLVEDWIYGHFEATTHLTIED